jgi:hypothetical protein
MLDSHLPLDAVEASRVDMVGSPVNAILVRPGCRLALAGALMAAAFLCSSPLMAAEAAPRETQTVIGLIDSGRFAEAESAIAHSLVAPDLSAEAKSALLFQRERMRRILLDFTVDADQARAQLRKQIPDLRDEEFARWDAAGLLEYQVIDGRKLYFNRAPSNLFRLSAEARARRQKQTPLVDGPMEIANAHHREVRDAALGPGTTGAGSRRIRVTQSLTVDADAVPATPGSTARSARRRSSRPARSPRRSSASRRRRRGRRRPAGRGPC